ncbi:oxidoreductase [Sphaerisporangium melleum]|uniref:Oxidoreductase n=1 Tax=Sphaerisporangium melleum TaxID=321316 RepID=A0A917R7E1_9ACTN|nr:FAD-dependent oxidoreductase [Sphaerisporangium melleum]GGK93160.1 oxidoreductase [Sphaerisporangium melleum]GII73443.1 oxidoreductase [Sphaerisporangium melleum]
MQTTCAIAGGGPAGAVLALLLARAGVEVTLLEKHADFLRDFRGDTIHPSTMQVLDELGLARALLALPHRKADRVMVWTDEREIEAASLRGLKSRFPYITFVPQWDFLNLITEAARRYPGFRLLMEAEVTGLIREGGAVRGLRYRDRDGEHELRATLTVGADGRHSDVRRAAGLVPVEHGAPMDALWFRLPREQDDPVDAILRVSAGRMMVAINRETYWQLAYLIPKGDHERVKAAGVASLRAAVASLLPFLAGRTEMLASMDEVSVLRVAVNRLRRWHRPGLLLIGDAAHAMSPVFGVGINLAVQDAVAAANLLAGALRAGNVPEALLARVQRRRTPPTVITQFAQRVVQARIIRPALRGSPTPVRLPRGMSRLPLIGALARRFIGLGVLPEHVRTPEIRAGSPTRAQY